MDILDFVQMARIELNVRYTDHDCAGPFIAQLTSPYHSVIHKKSYDDCMERSATGWGKTPELAIHNLCQNINKEISWVHVARNKDRSDAARDKFKIPKPLVYEKRFT